jgi:hypothetical protein
MLSALDHSLFQMLHASAVYSGRNAPFGDCLLPVAKHLKHEYAPAIYVAYVDILTDPKKNTLYPLSEITKIVTSDRFQRGQITEKKRQSALAS